jgi:hypothetical protein
MESQKLIESAIEQKREVEVIEDKEKSAATEDTEPPDDNAKLGQELPKNSL